GHGPVLEEDIALTNISLDLIGQARSLLTYAGEIEGLGRDEDKLAFFRDAGDFRNILLLEQPNGDFGDTVARSFLYDHFAFLLFESLLQSNDPQIAAIAAKSIKEVTYHRRHSSEWVIRLGDGTAESHDRIQESFNRLWEFSGEMFKADAIDHAVASTGAGTDPSSLYASWKKNVAEVLMEATLEMPADGWMQKGGKQGVHSEHIGFLLAEMQHIPRTYPDAQW
ncbi:MAG: phenylacetate-CoA oxygenase subunit PaaC, partial [Flavobacteriales bacterium]|nr:phenylacetate-CoA oxygenase subunit PaaC [Flavobacteriales bacterium]